MKKKLVVHCKKSPYDVYIGRPGPWGNPFSHLPNSTAEFKVDTREQAVDAYYEWFRKQPELVVKAKNELKDKVLGCWCSPDACHGDVLAIIANNDLFCDWCKLPAIYLSNTVSDEKICDACLVNSMG